VLASAGSVRLVSQTGTLDLGAAASATASSSVALIAGADLLVRGAVSGPVALEFRAGGLFATPGTDLLSFSAATVVIQAGSSITVNGTIAGSSRVELISDGGTSP